MPILDDILSLIAPNSCYGCQKDGNLICYGCQNSIVDNQKSNRLARCLICYRNIKSAKNICSICHNKLKLNKIYFTGYHQGIIKKMVWDIKFNSKISATKTAAHLIKLKLSDFMDQNLIIVPLPTAPKRVRARGYDQAKEIAKSLAKMNSNWKYRNILVRASDSDQIGRSRADRQSAGEKMFFLSGMTKLKGIKSSPVLLVDDVMTTGSTIGAAAKLLHSAGFRDISGAVLAYQPRDESSKTD